MTFVAHVGLVEAEFAEGQHRAGGEMQNVEDDERAHDGAAPDHGAGGVGSRDIVLLHVGRGPRGALEKPELGARRHVQDHRAHQKRADGPQRDDVGGVVQECGVPIDLVVVRGIDLQVADQVADDVAEQDRAGDGHDGFLADGGFIESGGALDGLGECAHADILGVQRPGPMFIVYPGRLVPAFDLGPQTRRWASGYPGSRRRRNGCTAWSTGGRRGPPSSPREKALPGAPGGRP